MMEQREAKNTRSIHLGKPQKWHHPEECVCLAKFGRKFKKGEKKHWPLWFVWFQRQTAISPEEVEIIQNAKKPAKERKGGLCEVPIPDLWW